METVIYTISVILIFLSLVATIWVARKPGEAKYDAKAKSNLSRLTIIYAVTTVISLLVFFFIYFV